MEIFPIVRCPFALVRALFWGEIVNTLNHNSIKIEYKFPTKTLLFREMGRKKRRFSNEVIFVAPVRFGADRRRSFCLSSTWLSFSLSL